MVSKKVDEKRKVLLVAQKRRKYALDAHSEKRLREFLKNGVTQFLLGAYFSAKNASEGRLK